MRGSFNLQYKAQKQQGAILLNNDMPGACVLVTNLADKIYQPLLAVDGNDGLPPLLNLGSNNDLTIAESANLIKEVVGFDGVITFDRNKPDGAMRKLMDTGSLIQLGWKAKTLFLQGMQQSYVDYLECV